MQLHIVSFDVPFPPNYGGVIDVFYKIKALHSAGVNIHLHCFQYGRAESAELNKYCASVTYYKRKTSPVHLLSDVPFIVATRKNEQLLSVLAADASPVLFEGLHCCAYLTHPLLKNKIKIVRTHNIEHDYYRALASVESKWSRRQYFKREADKLAKFEGELKHAQHILAISPADTAYLDSRYKGVHHVMAFHPNEQINCKDGSGNFALYHGNLEVGENNQAAIYLANEVFSAVDFPLVIAGNRPSEELINAIKGKKNITIKAGITTAEIDHLIREAHINVLPTFQATGIKLKLLAALFNGRHCLVNSPMVSNTGLDSVCNVSDTADQMRKAVIELSRTPFSADDIAKRKTVLGDRFSNRLNAEKIAVLIR